MADSPEGRFVGGETVALARLKHWVWDQDQLQHYFQVRNGLLGQAFSSKLSPWLAAGCISPRLIAAECRRYEKERIKNKSTYWLVFELLWRDYFQFQGLKQGTSLFQLQGPRSVQTGPWEWPGTQQDLKRWQEGQTGWPMVDANMRELRQTGFMSNRGRQIVASFLALELRVDWRQGADWFEQHLLDHDPTANWGNWAAAAGLFGGRINRFNVVKQANDYDKAGDYVRRWVPELSKVAGSRVHEPWKLSRIDLERAGIQLDRTYPMPMKSRFEWPSQREGNGKGGGKGGGKGHNKRPASGGRGGGQSGRVRGRTMTSSRGRSRIQGRE